MIARLVRLMRKCGGVELLLRVLSICDSLTNQGWRVAALVRGVDTLGASSAAPPPSLGFPDWSPIVKLRGNDLKVIRRRKQWLSKRRGACKPAAVCAEEKGLEAFGCCSLDLNSRSVVGTLATAPV